MKKNVKNYQGRLWYVHDRSWYPKKLTPEPGVSYIHMYIYIIFSPITTECITIYNNTCDVILCRYILSIKHMLYYQYHRIHSIWKNSCNRLVWESFERVWTLSRNLPLSGSRAQKHILHYNVHTIMCYDAEYIFGL